MAAYHRVYGSRHLQADCQEPGSAPESYATQSSMGYLYVLLSSRCVMAGASDLRLRRLQLSVLAIPLSDNNLGQVVHTPSSISWYRSGGSDALQLGR